MYLLELLQSDSFQKDCVAKLIKGADPSLYSHLRDTSAFTEGIPYNKQVYRLSSSV